MAQAVNNVNARRAMALNSLDCSTINKLRASGRDGQIYHNGEILIVEAGLLPTLNRIDNSDVLFLAYSCKGNEKQLSYKGLFGKHVVLDTLPKGTEPVSGLVYTDANNTTHEVFCVDRYSLKPRNARRDAAKNATKLEAFGAVAECEVFAEDFTLTVVVKQNVYISAPIDSKVRKAPKGQCFVYKVDEYATFE